jgi:TIR domain
MSKRPEIDDPDFLPPEVVEWAREHREVLERIVEQLLSTGAWPSPKDLTRQFVREDRPIAVGSLLLEMPRPLGFVETYPEKVVLLLFGLRMTHAGHKLLAGYHAIVRLAAERYASEDPRPVITREDVARGTVADDPYVTALSEVLLREAPFLGSGTGGPAAKWEREVTEDVVRYWHDANINAYLRTRAGELRTPPQLGWMRYESQGEPDAPVASNPEPANPEIFICHASEDKHAVARPLAEALKLSGHSVWLDESELVVGDSLSESIEYGLAHCLFGVVILSQAFFDKRWTKREMAGLTSREMIDGQRMILPVWHGIDSAFLAEQAPMLADLLAARTDDGIENVAAQISRAIQKRRR